jgi:hypothetical protein
LEPFVDTNRIDKSFDLTTVKILNIHERIIDGSVEQVGRLIDSLSSSNDLLWPIDRWTPMKAQEPHYGTSITISSGHDYCGRFAVSWMQKGAAS